jgi:hypothetical protein
MDFFLITAFFFRFNINRYFIKLVSFYFADKFIRKKLISCYEKVENLFKMTLSHTPLLNQDQNQIIYKWILQGALNNYCDQEPCDSINVTFTVTVFPIIQNNCYGCHSGGNPGGGISLTNYNHVKTAGAIPPGTPGSLLGAIIHAGGNALMPKNGNQLSECKIAQIRKLI